MIALLYTTTQPYLIFFFCITTTPQHKNDFTSHHTRHTITPHTIITPYTIHHTSTHHPPFLHLSPSTTSSQNAVLTGLPATKCGSSSSACQWDRRGTNDIWYNLGDYSSRDISVLPGDTVSSPSPFLPFSTPSPLPSPPLRHCNVVLFACLPVSGITGVQTTVVMGRIPILSTPSRGVVTDGPDFECEKQFF